MLTAQQLTWQVCRPLQATGLHAPSSMRLRSSTRVRPTAQHSRGIISVTDAVRCIQAARQSLPTTLVELLSSRDVAELVLGRLLLDSLASLTATCRGLRTSVPASAWQQAAQRAFPPAHPAREAPCVPSYLRQQHALHASVASGAFALGEQWTAIGVLAPDLRQHASLERSTAGFTLVVADLANSTSSTRLWVSLLPAQMEHLCDPNDVLWSADGQTVVIRYGDEWGLDLQPDSVQSVHQGPAGLIVADLRRGAASLLELPSQTALLDAGVLLTCSQMSAATHCLIVLQAGAEKQLVLRAINAFGSEAASTAAPVLDQPAHAGELADCSLEWSPCGQWAVMCIQGASWLCLWQPFVSAALLRVELPLVVITSIGDAVCWAPCSSMLLVYNGNQECAVCCLDGTLSTTQELEEEQRLLAWDLCGVTSLTESAGIHGCSRLLWRSVQDRQLQEPHASLTLQGQRVFNQTAICSPDGAFCACVTWQAVMVELSDGVDQARLFQPQLLVVRSDSGEIQLRQPIQCLYTGTEWVDLAPHIQLTWSGDGSALVCSNSLGSGHVTLSFAGMQ